MITARSIGPKNESTIIIDTDMGHDDVMAIAMLLATQTPILGITTVNGLCHVHQGTENVLRLLDRVRLPNIPVAIGADKPLTGDHAFKSQWREKVNALAAVNLPFTNLKPHPLSAAEFLVDEVNRHPGQVTLLCLGPLTNIAMALQFGGKDFAQNVRQIIMMGGAVHVPGNNTPNEVSEWNIYIDPEAAAITINSGIAITMIGLDVTNQAPYTDELANYLRGQTARNPAGFIMQEVLQGMSSYLYDAVAAAYLLDPSVVVTTRLPVQVVIEGGNAGQTAESSSGTPIEVALNLDQDHFHEILQTLINNYDQEKP